MLSLSDTNPRFLQSWLRFQYMLQKGLVSPIHQQNTIYVDGTYGVPAGERNNPSRPFQTVQQGVDAALANDLVLIAPGNYVENVDMPETDGLTVIGASSSATFILGVLGVAAPAIGLTAPATVARWTFSDFAVANQSPAQATPSFNINCTGSTTAFEAGRLVLNNILFVSAGANLFLRNINSFRLESCEGLADAVLQQCSRGEIRTTNFNQVTIDYQLALDEPVSGLSTLEINSGKFDLVVTNLANVRITDSDVSIAATVTDDAGGRYGQVDAASSKLVDVAAVATGATVASMRAIRLSNCDIGSLSLQRNAGAAIVDGQAQNCNFIVLGDGTISSDGAALDIRGSLFQESKLTAPNAGTIDRSFIQFSVQSDSAGWAGPGTWTGTYSVVPLPDVPIRVFATTSTAAGAAAGDLVQASGTVYPNISLLGFAWTGGVATPVDTGANVLIVRDNQ